MDAAEVDASIHINPSYRPRQTVTQPLSDLEQALLAVLDDQFVSACVVRNRARLMALKTPPTVVRTLLSSVHPIAIIAEACHELERRGLAERVVAGRFTLWRQSEAGSLEGEVDH